MLIDLRKQVCYNGLRSSLLQCIFGMLIIGVLLAGNSGVECFPVDEPIENDFEIQSEFPDGNFGSDISFYIKTENNPIYQTDAFLLLSPPVNDYDSSKYQLNSLSLTLKGNFRSIQETNTLMIYQAITYNQSGTWNSENGKYDSGKFFTIVEVSDDIIVPDCSDPTCHFILTVDLTDVGKELIETDLLSLYLTFGQ